MIDSDSMPRRSPVDESPASTKSPNSQQPVKCPQKPNQNSPNDSSHRSPSSYSYPSRVIRPPPTMSIASLNKRNSKSFTSTLKSINQRISSVFRNRLGSSSSRDSNDSSSSSDSCYRK
ncbi:unnamed protein product [Oikopleura dioica]|uniref:Uncharacterized protein n=1 Tax=Oikopleura dioica TaxID=34765 RepID=E4X3Y6_OIKDI|nr:unnamed protein product [Oikopleura dioica]